MLLSSVVLVAAVLLAELTLESLLSSAVVSTAVLAVTVVSGAELETSDVTPVPAVTSSSWLDGAVDEPFELCEAELVATEDVEVSDVATSLVAAISAGGCVPLEQEKTPAIESVQTRIRTVETCI